MDLRFLSLLLAAALTVQPVAASDEASDTISRTLREIEVVARRIPAATAQTLSGGQLQGLSATSIADALKYFAGAQIKDYGGLGGLKTINVRSLGAQHVGVYIDGVRITNAQNGTVDLGKYSLSTLESVSLYNANKLESCQSASEYASGATVYLRTRRPASDSLSVLATCGSFHTYRGRVNAQFSRNGWQGFIDVEYLNSRGDYRFRYKTEYEDTVGVRRNSDIEYYRAEGALFRGGFESHAYCYFSERGCPGGIVRRLTGRYENVGREWDTDVFVQATYNHRFSENHRMRFNLRYSHEYLRYNTDYPENQNTAKVDNHYWQNDAYASAAYTWQPLRGVSFNVSYDSRLSWLDANLRRFSPVRRLDQKAVAALDANWRNFRLAVSALYQHYKDHTKVLTGAADPLSRLTPSVSLAYSVGNVSLRTWYKRIFRAPTLNDLYYTQAGNRNLKPEYTRQFDLGIEYNLVAGQWIFLVQADAYINNIDNRIVCLPVRGTYTWSMMNYGRTFCRGLNANTTLRYSHGPLTLSLTGSFTWQRDLNRTNPDDKDTYDKPICYSPDFSCGLTAYASWRWLSVTVSELYVAGRMWSYADPEDMLAPYNNVDMRVCGNWRRFCLSMEINDVLDVQYEHIPRYPMPGRNIRFSLGYNF